MSELQKITISTNHWYVPSVERALDGWFEGKPSEKEIRQAQATAIKERAVWKPTEEGLQLVEQLKAFIGTRVQIQFWISIMSMCDEEGPFPLEGDCKDVLLLQQDGFLQAFMALDNFRVIPKPEGFTAMGFLTTVDGIHGRLASLADVYEVGPVNPDGSVSAEQQDKLIREVESYNVRMMGVRELVKDTFTEAECARMYPLWSEKRQAEEVALASLAVNADGDDDATTKPALHLMPETGITADGIFKMFTATTGNEPSAQDRAECEAMLATAVAKKSIPKRHRLAGVLTEAMSEPRFMKQWLDDTDTSFRPFAATVLDLCNAKRMTEKSRRAVYQDLCVRRRQEVLTDLVGKPVPPKVFKLMSRTNWKEFSRRDWVAFISVVIGPDNSKLGHVNRITPTLVRQIDLIPDELRTPALYQVVSQLKVPAERWNQLRGFLNGASAAQRTEYRRAAKEMTSNGDFWDLYHRCEGKHYRQFNFPASVGDSKLLIPIASPREMELEARRMKSCLANQVRRVHDGDRIYFKLVGNVKVNADLVRQEKAWIPGDILGYENAPVAPELRRRIAAELQRLAQAMPTEGESSNKKVVDGCIEQLRLNARHSFAADEIAHLSGFLTAIQGKSRSWTDGAYTIVDVSQDRYVQFLSSPDGKEYLMEISSHRYVESVNNCLTDDAVDLLEMAGFIWPTERTNFYRWFKVSCSEDLQAMAELALAMLDGIFGYRTGERIKVANHFPV